jgi:hypothetical protein
MRVSRIAQELYHKVGCLVMCIYFNSLAGGMESVKSCVVRPLMGERVA